MSRKKSFLTATDQFCGAGGSTQGAKKAGVEVRMALNHWKLAIETHSTNNPETDHDCTDIQACDPRRYPSTDILITSPECTNHSLAKGIKIVQKQMEMFNSGKIDAAAERSRATMWDVCRFAEFHNYNAVIVENVVDARKWVMFDAWLAAMYALGYLHKCVYLNSMHCHPTPQSRDRMYIVFWKKGNKVPKLDYTPLSHCLKCGKDVQAVQTWKRSDVKHGKYRQQYVYSCPVDGSTIEPYYYAAFNCIDWSDLGTRIGDRKLPLSPNTTKRINYGLNKYGKQSFLVDDKQSTGINFRVRSTSNSVNTVHTDPRIKLVMPFTIQTVNGGEDQHRSKSALDASFTHTILQSQGVVVPFIIKGEHTLQEGYVRGVNEPAQTQTVRQSMSLVTPYIIEMNRTGECKPALEATATMTAGGINHAVLQPPFIVENKGKSNAKAITEVPGSLTTKPHLGLVSNESWNSFIASYYSASHCVNHITEESGTVTTNDRQAIVNYQNPKIEDCYYRMLKPHEIKLAMAFDKDYIVLGSGKDQVKQLGNAVTPPAMEWLVKQVVNSLS